MMFPKHPLIRLTGKALAKLVSFVHERDNYKCVNCGADVDPGEKPHHEPCGRYKEDVPEKMCDLCYKCHQKRESKDGEPIKQRCIAYLDEQYPDRRERFQIPA